jgi:protein phosphatase
VIHIKLPRNTLLLLCGPAGAGKSTFAAKHFLPSQVISSDECRALISDDATNQAVSGHAFELMNFIITRRLSLGRLTIGDATYLEPGIRRVMTRTATRLRFNAAAIVFDVSLETCLKRNRARPRSVPESAILRQHAMLIRTLATIAEEGFDHVHVLNEQEQSGVDVEIGRRVTPHPTTRPVRRR